MVGDPAYIAEAWDMSPLDMLAGLAELLLTFVPVVALFVVVIAMIREVGR